MTDGIQASAFGASGSAQTTTGSVNIAEDPKRLTVADIQDFQIGQYVSIPKAGEESYKAWRAELTTDPTEDGTFVLTLDGAEYLFPYTIQYETIRLTFTDRVQTQGAILLKLDGVEVSVPLLGNESSPEQAAARLGETPNRNRFIGWSVTVSGPIVTFTARRPGRKGEHTFDPNGTGTAAVLDGDRGRGSAEDIMEAVRSVAYPGWTTSGYGPSVLFTSQTPGPRTGVFRFDRTGTGATGFTGVLDDGILPHVTRIEDIQDRILILRDPALRSAMNVTISHDDTIPIQEALDNARDKGEVVRLSGTHNISSTLRVYSKSYLRGDGPHSTVLQTVRSIRLMEAAGAYLGEGPPVSGLQLENLQLNGKDMGTQGLYVKGGRNIRIAGCRFINFLEEFVCFDEVYDSLVTQSYFTNGFRPSSGAIFLLHYGGPDNTNQIHFHDVVWETMVRPAVRLVSGAGSSNAVNEIYFNNCKWESIYPTSFVEMFGAVNVYFNMVNFCLPRTTSSKRTAGIYADNCRCIYITNLNAEFFQDPNPQEVGYEAPFMAAKNTSYVQIMNAMMTGRMPAALFDNIIGCSMLTHVGAFIGQDFKRSITAGQNMNKNWYNSNIRIMGAGTEPSLELQRTDDTARWIYFIGRIDASGNLRIMDGNGRNLLQLAGETGETQTQYGLRVSEKWNSGNLLRLGNYRLWVDASGNLRKKNGIPTSDTDGTVV